VAQRGGSDGGSGEAWGRRTPTSWGGPERGGGCTDDEVEAEGGSGCQHAENCKREGGEGARWLLARTGKGRRTRLTDDARKTVMWDGRWRTTGRQTTLTFLINSIEIYIYTYIYIYIYIYSTVVKSCKCGN
jgi:hypothetical protein